ncbi:MAG: TetR/AcrR family transcriptional regulator [Ferruginibacter sp.]|nr:TetR/AcrR family transcriptional regulator [Bacteroidota bacterium]MBX2917608.1 TetR/AcrR family transcriptional regulator [Ferruginibacter sp.]
MAESDTKQRIKQAANDLVMQYGIRSVSMDDIAAKLGISKKTIYLYFKDKDELVDEIVGDIIVNNRYECNADRDRAENAIHEIFLVMDMMAEMFTAMNPGILFDMQKYHPATFKKFLKHKNEFLYNVCRENLERGIQEELYRPDLAVDILCRYRVETMFIPFNPDFQQSLKYNLAKIEEEIIIHFLFGLVSLKGYKLVMKYWQQRETKKN